MKTLHTLPMVLLVVFLCGCPATTRGPSNLRPGEMAHAASGILFPEHVLGFARGQIRAYDSSGRDVSVGYDLVDPQNPVVITVYVYPAPKLTSIGSPADVVETVRRKLTDNHFQGVKAEIMRSHPQASLLSERQTAMQFQGQSLYGRSARFKSRERFAHRTQPVISHAEVFAFGKWLIKFRITHPTESEDEAKHSIDEFKTAFCEANERAPNQSIQATK